MKIIENTFFYRRIFVQKLTFRRSPVLLQNILYLEGLISLEELHKSYIFVRASEDPLSKKEPFLSVEELYEVFYIKMSFMRSSICRRVLEDLLFLEEL